MRFILAVLFATLASGATRAEQAGAHRAVEPAPADPPPLVFYEREIQATDGDWIIGHKSDPAVQARQEAALIEATRAARQAGAAVPRSGMAPWALDEPSIPDTTGDWIVGFGSGAPAATSATPSADDASGTPSR